MKTYREVEILDGVYEVELDVEYSIYGKNRPATYYEPPEYAELEIESITYKIVDSDTIITDEIKKQIESQIDHEVLEEECWYEANHHIDDHF